MKKTIPLTLILALAAVACGDAAASDTTEPEPSQVFVESVEFMYLESYPVQVRAAVAGNLPTPCHVLDWKLDDSDPDKPILTLTATADPDEVCAQVLEPFEITVDVGAYETGEYELIVNGERHPFTI